jgi:hypothetical protein
MFLQQITDEKDLKDGRTYLCCRSSRQGNAIWETLEAQKHLLLHGELRMPMKSFSKIFDLPKRLADIDATDGPT